METSITNKMVSQQTICGNPESLNLEITNNTESKLTHSKDQIEIEQTWKNLMKARNIYFKYFPSQKMAHTKGTVKRKAVVGIKTIPQPRSGWKIIEWESLSRGGGKVRTWKYWLGTKALREIWKFQSQQNC